MKGPEFLLEQEDRWVTRMGLSFPGKRVVFRGKDLFHDCKDMRWMGLLLFGITGRWFDDSQIRLFEGIWTISTSYPDPRIWNNRVAALAGTARSTGALGIGAALAVSEADIYGGKPVIESIDFLIRTRLKLSDGDNLGAIIRAYLRKHRRLPGYGRPIVKTDERIVPLLELAERLGFSQGAHVKLALEIEDYLVTHRWRMRMNVAALIAALAADQGLGAQEHYLYMTLCFNAGFIPCFIEACAKEEGAFLPIPCDRISYQGPATRSWDVA